MGGESMNLKQKSDIDYIIGYLTGVAEISDVNVFEALQKPIAMLSDLVSDWKEMGEKE